MPTKKQSVISPLGVVTSPAIAVGIAPAKRTPIKTQRSPKQSQRGPEIAQTRKLVLVRHTFSRRGFHRLSYIARSATIFKLAISA